MATIGTALTAPESGWKRYDDTDVNIKYNGDWQTIVNNDLYNSSGHYSPNNHTGNESVEFSFVGTKIRLLSVGYNNYSTNHKIFVDGVEYVFSTKTSTTIYQLLAFELVGLENKVHDIRIEIGTDGIYQRLYIDAIDIDDSGMFGKPYNKILILSNDKVLSVEEGGYTENLIPVMTSNTTPSGEASASSESDNINLAWKAFNKETANTYWQSSNILPSWLQYEFDTPKKINRYGLKMRSLQPTQAPKNWTFEGSDDGVNWIVLDTQNNITNWIDHVTEKTFDIANEHKYKRYRINVSSTNGSAFLSISEFNLYGKIDSKIKYSNSISEQNFINHGLDKDTEIDLNAEMTNKVFIEQSSTPLGEGKVFKQSIDTSKMVIKKVEVK